MDLSALARLQAAGAVVVEEVQLRLGAEVVARVLAAEPGGGRGLLSLAGKRVAAQLPPGLEAGQRLALRVAGEESGRLVLRILRPDGGDDAGDALGRLAAHLAVSGDPDLLRLALVLAPGAVPLPGGSAASVAVDPDEAKERGEDAERHRALVTLHSPELGPIEIALSLERGAVAAAVSVEPGEPATLARAAAADLAGALEAALGRPASVSVTTRQARALRPAPPGGLEWVDVRA